VSGFRPARDGAKARFSLDEAKALGDLATRLASLIANRGEPGSDAALDRLLPDAYRENDEYAAEFRRFTEDDLADEKVRNALTLVETLEPRPRARFVEIELDAAAALAWLRAIGDIRLALAVRMEIGEDGEPAMVDDNIRAGYAIYSWLAMLQETLVLAIDG
jgi:hypothetical protein